MIFFARRSKSQKMLWAEGQTSWNTSGFKGFQYLKHVVAIHLVENMINLVLKAMRWNEVGSLFYDIIRSHKCTMTSQFLISSKLFKAELLITFPSFSGDASWRMNINSSRFSTVLFSLIEALKFSHGWGDITALHLHLYLSPDFWPFPCLL